MKNALIRNLHSCENPYHSGMCGFRPEHVEKKKMLCFFLFSINSQRLASTLMRNTQCKVMPRQEGQVLSSSSIVQQEMFFSPCLQAFLKLLKGKENPDIPIATKKSGPSTII